MGIFEPYRALGYITAGVPFSVQRRGTETFVTVSVGKTWQIYDVRYSMFFLDTTFQYPASVILFFVGISYLKIFFFIVQCAKLTLVLVGEFTLSFRL